MIMTDTNWVWNPRCLRPPSTRAAVPRRFLQPQDTRCQEQECFHSWKRAHAGDAGRVRARAAKSRKYQPLGSQFTCFLGVSIGNFIAPLPRGEEMKRRKIIVKSSSFTRLGTAVQQNNFQGWGSLGLARGGTRERQVENTGLGENWKQLRGLHRVRGGGSPWEIGKVRSARDTVVREAREDASAKQLPRCGRLGTEQPEGRRKGEAHGSVTPAPEGVCAHTPAHTHSHTQARARAQPGTPASLGRAERARPTPAAAPRPWATPPAPHPAKAIGRRGGAAPEERAVGAAPRKESAKRVEAPAPGLGQRQAADLPVGRRGAAAGWPGGRRGPGSGRRARRYLLARPAGGRAGVEAAAARGGVAAGDTLGCLEGAAGGGGRAAAALPQTTARGGRGVNLLSPLPPGHTPPSFLSSFFLLPRLVVPPAPRTHGLSALRAGGCQP